MKKTFWFGGLAISAIVILFFFFSGSGNAPTKNSLNLTETERTASFQSNDTMFDPSSSEEVIKPIYFYSYQYEDEQGPYSVKCPQTKDIDWELAIYTLSAHMELESHGEDYGPAAIQRNFDENCDRNIGIYERLAAHLQVPENR